MFQIASEMRATKPIEEKFEEWISSNHPLQPQSF